MIDHPLGQMPTLTDRRPHLGQAEMAQIIDLRHKFKCLKIPFGSTKSAAVRLHSASLRPTIDDRDDELTRIPMVKFCTLRKDF